MTKLDYEPKPPPAPLRDLLRKAFVVAALFLVGVSVVNLAYGEPWTLRRIAVLVFAVILLSLALFATFARKHATPGRRERSGE